MRGNKNMMDEAILNAKTEFGRSKNNTDMSKNELTAKLSEKYKQMKRSPLLI